MSEEIQKAIRERGDELLESIKEEIFLCEISSDLDRFGRLVSLYHHHSSFELLKALRDKGLDKEISELADKAGRLKKRERVE